MRAANAVLMPVTNGSMLAMIADGWMPLLNPFPWDDEVAAGLRQRGKFLFGVAAQILGCADGGEEEAGELWSLVDAALHCSDAQSREYLLDEARKIALPARIPKALRAVTVLGALAAADARGSGRLGRVAAALVHRASGRFPR